MTTRACFFGGMIACTVLFTGCNQNTGDTTPQQETTVDGDAALADNPLLQTWDTPYGVPPFAQIRDEHYEPAIMQGIAELEAEITAIVDNPDAPTFENTIVALDKAGSTLERALNVFGNITNTDTNDTLRALESTIYPKVSKVYDSVVFNQKLFARVKEIKDAAWAQALDEQDARLITLTYRMFDRAGADLPEDARKRLSDINAEISGLMTQFGQNVLKATKAFRIEITTEDQLAGLSDTFKAAIRKDDVWVLTLDRSVYETFMTQSSNRDLRQKMFDGYRNRASGGELDNGPVAIKLAQLRAEQAELLGYRTYAEYVLEYNMAKTPKTVEDFLVRVWQPGLEQAIQDRETMQAMIGDDFRFAGHDWWYYAEKLRQKRYAFDDTTLKPYFELEAVWQGAFRMADGLFGIMLDPVTVEGWNPVVTTYDVRDKVSGAHLGLFMVDMYARDSKRGGAWMNSYRDTSDYHDAAAVRPVITNNLNLIMPADGAPVLMRFDEVETLFHEFGHGLHGLLTKIRYKEFSGVDGPRDYTEFPAQILEHWASAPEMLSQYARHYQTGQPIPQALIDKMYEARNHNQGFKTTEFIAAALLDFSWHNLTHDEAMAITDARRFEVDALAKYGLIDEIEPRYRTPYFSHIFAGGYSSGYYAYLWSEILDADGFMAFREKGDIFDKELATRLKKWIYEAGGLRPADELYRQFRGSDPTIEPLLRNRGFATGEEETGG